MSFLSLFIGPKWLVISSSRSFFLADQFLASAIRLMAPRHPSILSPLNMAGATGGFILAIIHKEVWRIVSIWANLLTNLPSAA
jgi:hypothetical protein